MIRRRFFRRPQVAFITGILLILGAVVVTMSVAASSPAACGSCHKKQVVDLARTPHESIACARCHQSAGVEGVLSMRVRAVAMFGSQLPGSPKSFVPVDSVRCLECHPNIVKGTITSPSGIRMSHKEPLDSGQQCVECHADVAHPNAYRGGGVAMMDDCVRCHTVSTLSADCVKCHAEPVSREKRVRSGNFVKTHGKDWKKLHGMGNLATCSACHTAARCKACHGVPLPHEGTWLNTHGPKVSADSALAARCDSCHDKKKFCDPCHVVPMPHPRDFRRQHSGTAEDVGREACARCHHPDACKACHISHTHPGLAPERRERLRKKAGL